MRLRHDGAQPLQAAAGLGGCDLAGLGRRSPTTATTRPSRPAASTRSTRKVHALAPVVRGREAVVDEEQQRRRAAVCPPADSRPARRPPGSEAPRAAGAAAAATTACAPASRAPAAGRRGSSAAGSRRACGCGGVMRSSSQIAGRAASAVSTSGAAKVRGRPSIVSRPPDCVPPRDAATRVTRRSAASLAGRSVRWIVSVQPRRRARSSSAAAVLLRCGRDRPCPRQPASPTRKRQAVLEIVQDGLALEREGLLDRVDDHHEMAARAARRDALDRRGDRRARATGSR